MTKPHDRYWAEVYDRQRAGGTRPLVDNPTADEVIAELQRWDPQDVLEVGCGWGRLLEPVNKVFDAAGCDYSRFMLDRIPAPLRYRTFQWDITQPFKGTNVWSVAYTRGVMVYMQRYGDLGKALANLLTVTERKLIFWEWPETLEAIVRELPEGAEHMVLLRPIEHRTKE